MLARFGQFLLFERLNQGGMAEVYLAKSYGLHGADRILVLKCIRPEYSADPSFVAMFVEEAKLASMLSHQNIVRTYELGCVGSRHFIAMEYLPGRDLRATLLRLEARNRAMPEELALYIVAQACDGLDYAHRKSGLDGDPLHIVHRDVSPPNILIGYDGQIKLIDFGVAKVTARAEHSRVLKGKYAYMSPEQARGQRVDRRSDVFAAGILLFELLTSKRLFSGRNELSVLDKVRAAESYPPRLAAPSVTSRAERIVLQSLSRDPSRRYQSAGEMRDDIVALLLDRKSAGLARQLSAMMTELFFEEHTRDEARQSELRAMAVPSQVPELEDLSPQEVPSKDPNEPDTTVTEKLPAAKASTARWPLRVSYVVILGLVLLVVFLLALLATSAAAATDARATAALTLVDSDFGTWVRRSERSGAPTRASRGGSRKLPPIPPSLPERDQPT